MRKYIRELDERGDLLHIDREVDPRFELAAVTQAVQRSSDQPTIFHRVRGTAMPVVTNVYGSRNRLAEILRCPPEAFTREWSDIAAHLPDTTASAEAADNFTDTPRVHGKVSDLPLITYCEKDGAPYFTSAIFLAREPDTGTPNLSFHRSMYVSDEELRVRLAPRHHLTAYQERAERLGRPLDAALLIGPPKELFLAAAAPIAYDADEMQLAAAIAGHSFPMQRCKEIDLDVPADTEIVIEGRFLPNVRRPEGPFGEFMGYYTPVGDNAVFEVLNVSWRSDPVFHSILCGSQEEVLTLEMSVAANIYRHLNGVLPGIVDVNCAPFVTHAIVQIDQQYPGHAEQVALATVGADPTWCKMCTVVDRDVNIYDLADVMWAVLTRARLDDGAHLIKGVPSFYRDPYQDHWGRLMINATAPFERRGEFERKRVPGAADVDLAQYVRK